MNVDALGEGAEKVYKAGEIFIPPGFYRVEEITTETCTIRRMPASGAELAFRFHQKAPARWVVGATVEARLNPSSPTGRTIKRWEDWDSTKEEAAGITHGAPETKCRCGQTAPNHCHCGHCPECEGY